MRDFRPDDIAEITGWYLARGVPAPEVRVYPTTGIIEPGVAAGFCYATDSALCLLEGFVTNPAAPPRAAARSIYRIARSLLGQVEESDGIALALCQTPGMARRAARHGLRPVGNYVLLSK